MKQLIFTNNMIILDGIERREEYSANDYENKKSYDNP